MQFDLNILPMEDTKREIIIRHKVMRDNFRKFIIDTDEALVECYWKTKSDPRWGKCPSENYDVALLKIQHFLEKANYELISETVLNIY